MFKRILTGLLRSSIILDYAMDAQEAVLHEVRVASIALAVAAFGAGIFAASLLILARSFSWLSLALAIVGALAGAAGGLQLYVSRKKLIRYRDIFTAKGVRDAASTAISAGSELASRGVSSVSAAGQSIVTRVVSLIRSHRGK